MTGWGIMLLTGTYGVWLLEQRATTGRWRLIPAFKAAYHDRTIRPNDIPRRDTVFFNSAPFVLAMAVVFAAAVLPLSPSVAAIPMATGALFVNAALAYVMAAAVMAGWAPNREFPLIGAWRFLGQFLAYGMPIVMAIAAVAMRAESLDVTAVVQSQAGLWNIAYQPLGFILFFVSAMALAFLPPFDSPVAQSEIRGGIFESYSGWRYIVMLTSRTTLMLVLAWAVTMFYLGGWFGPLLPDWLWSVLKTLAVVAVMVNVGRLVPRLTLDKLLAIGWKAAIPMALLNIFIVALLLLGGLQ